MDPTPSLVRAAVRGVEAEAADCHTCFFSVPNHPPEWAETTEDTLEDPGVVELSIYDLDRDGVVLSLEADASDNDWLTDDADQLAETMVEALGGQPLDL